MPTLPESAYTAAVDAARARDLPADKVLAFVDVESNGQAFSTVDGERRPVILFEPHVFHKRLSGAERDAAVAEGLAYPKWGTRSYPNSQEERWDQIRRAAEINPQAAFESASYGLGQVMGYHWRALGYDSVEHFVDRMSASAEAQIEAMLRYLEANDLIDELIAGAWTPLARGYNGPGFRKHNYHIRLRNAAARFGAGTSEPDGMLRMGAKGRRVRELQALLVRAGFPVKVDGDFGPATRAALKAFQSARTLAVDGIYGPETEDALAGYRQAPDEEPGAQKLSEVDEVKQGAISTGTAVTLEVARQAVDKATADLAGLGLDLPIIDWLTTSLTVASAVLAVAGIAWGAYGWFRSHRTVEA